ncbi:MAG: adenylosuccinate lyase, partial [Anaerolineales bacterium]
QTILRAVGKSDAYETLKEKTRGQVLTESEYKTWCDSIDVDDVTRNKLKKLSPESYIGLAIELTEKIAG